MKPGLTTVTDNVPAFLAAVRVLATQRVMVGVPDANAHAGRAPGDKLNNAEIAYVQDRGDPASNIPARPFLGPGILRARSTIEGWLRRAGVAALAGSQAGVDRALQAAGMAAASSVKAVITAGIPPPLAPSTVEGRIARRRSRTWRAKRRAEVAANVAGGLPPGEGLFTPLIDTGALRASITWVIRRVR